MVKLWREDIDESEYEITFSGGVFVLKRNIEDTRLAAEQTLRDYRFKKVQYKWYKGAREYINYDISSSKDGKIKTGSQGNATSTNIIETPTINKSLIKAIDILGRETTNKGLQLHIYDDGSVEKKYLIK